MKFIKRSNQLKNDKNFKIPTGIRALDKEINGGLQSGIVHFYGGPNTGKSNLALQIMKNAIEKLHIYPIWIDMNGSFSYQRFKDISQDDMIIKHIFLITIEGRNDFLNTITGLKDLFKRNKKIKNTPADLKLLIIDPVIFYYRLNVNLYNSFSLRVELDEKIMGKLYGYTIKENLCIILINQISVKKDKMKYNIGICHNIINRHSRYSILFEKKNGNRNLILKKISNFKTNRKIPFTIYHSKIC
ncbi:MAG: hypothetical protein GF329_16160 [Candidatus Lokiarchaeota archaeon]|nr:hypothetical protein [Candidatus Lokiarchaeota archaeon]